MKNDLLEDFNYFEDLEGIMEDPDCAPLFQKAVEEFGVEPEYVGVFDTYSTDHSWNEIKDALNERGIINYLEFESGYGESAIIFDVRDL